MIRLSEPDLFLFDSNPYTEQLLSTTHVIVRSDTTVYKVLYSPNEKDSLQLYWDQFERASSLPSQSHDVRCPSKQKWWGVVKYLYLPFNCLDRTEAKGCLKEFVKLTKVALDELHGFGLSRNDIRMANILFDADYRLIMLIDLDRADYVSKVSSFFSTEMPSCMYTHDDEHIWKDGIETDFYQLGWLIAWILKPKKKVNYPTTKEFGVRNHNLSVRTDWYIASL